MRRARRADPLPHTARALTSRVKEAKATGEKKGKGQTGGQKEGNGERAGKDKKGGASSAGKEALKQTWKCIHSRAYHAAKNAATRSGKSPHSAKEGVAPHAHIHSTIGMAARADM